MIKRLARLTSNILNPFLVSFVLTILLAFEATSSTADAIRWASISVALSVLPVFIVVVYLVRRKKLDSVFENPQHQRDRIYLLASALAVIDCIVLFYLEAPELLRVTFVAGLVAIVIFMVINRFWKISLHTAFIAASVSVLIIVYGAAGAWTAVLLPLVAWARIETRLHSPMQVVTGALLAAAIVLVVFWCFGMINGQV
jgi:membrane-associated phospholipid phosphatase